MGGEGGRSGEWEGQREALRRWSERGRAVWLVGEGVNATLGMLAEGRASAEDVVAGLEELLSRAGFCGTAKALAIGAGGRQGPEPVGRVHARPATERWKEQVTRVWRDGDRPLGRTRYVVLFVGAVTVRGVWATVAVGVTTDGTKQVLGLWRGCTADAVVAREVIEGLSARGFDVGHGVLVVHDGSQALDLAVRKTWGRRVVLAHCQQCVSDEVAGHLPERDRSRLRQELRAACSAPSEAGAQLTALVSELRTPHPGAAQRLQRSCEALCSVAELAVPAPLREHLQAIGPIRQLGEAAARAKGSGAGPSAVAAVLPTVLAGMRRLIGYRALPVLSERLEARVAETR